MEEGVPTPLHLCAGMGTNVLRGVSEFELCFIEHLFSIINICK